MKGSEITSRHDPKGVGGCPTTVRCSAASATSTSRAT